MTTIYPPGLFLQEELDARGWSVRQLAERMGGEIDVNELACLLLIEVHDPTTYIGTEMAEQLGQALGTGAQFWLNLDAQWRGKPL